MNVTVNAAANRVNGWTYDANGNVTQQGSFYGVYDVENRLLEASKNSTILYGYGADNRRIYESRRTVVATNGDGIQENVTYWSGQRLGVYRIRWNSEFPSNGQPNSFVFAKVEENLYFGSKPLRLGSVTAPETNIAVDRLGSIRRSNKDYFPYGQEAPTTTAGDKEKYATYKHDAATDLSYADQRYYATGAGRFMTADPYKASAGAGDPGSWNRYAYVEGDPVNFNDPAGLASCWVEEWAPDGQGAKVRCQSQSGTQNSETVWYSVSGISTANKDMVEKDARTTIGRRLDLAEASEYLGRALAKAHEAMKDPECRKLFGTNLVDPITGGTLDPDIVLNGLVHGAHGSITYVESLGEGITAQTQGSGLRFSGLSPYYQKANVTIAMDLWNLGFAQENTTTLLHELGHVMNKLTAGFGSSNAFEEYDGISPGASARNTQLVQDSCIRKLQF